MNSISEKVHELNEMIIRGELLEALDKFYAADVVMQENDLEPTNGKGANREREKEFLKNVTEFRSAKALKVSIGSDISMVEWHFDYTHKEWGVRDYMQVSVQEWKDGKIIREKFYYAN